MNKATLKMVENIYTYVEQGDSDDLDIAWSTFLSVLNKVYNIKVPKANPEVALTMFTVQGDFVKVLSIFVDKYKIVSPYEFDYCNELCKILLTYIRCEKFPVSKSTFIYWVKKLNVVTYIEDCKDLDKYYHELWECIILLRYIVLEKILPKTYQNYNGKVYIGNIVCNKDKSEVVFVISTEVMLKQLGAVFENEESLK